METIELISFEICPFVQRSVITLLEKNVPFKTTYIDLANKPDWFLEISPLGKVPVLKVNEKDVLFESAVINEYLDEITPPQLVPSDPLEKAQMRAWIEYASAVLMAQYGWSIAEKNEYADKEKAYYNKLDYLEKSIENGSFFKGETFSLADSALAPALMRHALINRWRGEEILGKWPKLARLQRNYMTRPSIVESVVEHFEVALKSYMLKNNSYLVVS